MSRGSASSNLSERLRSYSNRYASDNSDDHGTIIERSSGDRGSLVGSSNGGLISKRQEELRTSSSRTRERYDREHRDLEKESSPASDRYRREGSSGRSDLSDRSSSGSSSGYVGSSRYGYLSERSSTSSSVGGVANGSPASPTAPASTYSSDPSLGNRLSTKRETRDAFFSKSGEQMAAPKFDPSTLRERERDKEREKEKIAYSGSTMTSQPQSNSHSNHVGSKDKEIEGYVGFANLPNQVYRKSVKRGFEFTLMVVGESGLGKSTLINSMFLADLYSAEYPGPSLRTKKTVQVENTQVVLKEGGVQLRLTTVDTPGFGDAVDNSNCWQPVIDFIESKYDEYLNAESRVNRRTMPDNRVHCCLYFISPNGHGLKPLDVEFMKRLHDKVNIIPLIAKADTLTPDECREFKKTILNEIARHKIKIYEFPDADDEEENKLQKKLKDRVPFAVVGSNAVVESHGRKVRGRMYPWGIVEVENLEHNDFIALRNMLIRTYLQDLKDVTNNVHYENFRYNKLASVATGGKDKNTSGKFGHIKNPLIMMEDERKEHVTKMKKMEAEMEQVFEMKVKEKKQKLKDSELDLQRRAEQMKKSLEQQQKELEEKRRAFERERSMWEEQQRALEEQRRRSLENAKETAKKEKKKSLF